MSIFIHYLCASRFLLIKKNHHLEYEAHTNARFFSFFIIFVLFWKKKILNERSQKEEEEICQIIVLTPQRFWRTFPKKNKQKSHLYLNKRERKRRRKKHQRQIYPRVPRFELECVFLWWWFCLATFKIYAMTKREPLGPPIQITHSTTTYMWLVQFFFILFSFCLSSFEFFWHKIE